MVHLQVGLQREGTPQSEAKTFQGDQVEGKEELTKTATKGQNPVSSEGQTLRLVFAELEQSLHA